MRMNVAVGRLLMSAVLVITALGSSACTDGSDGPTDPPRGEDLLDRQPWGPQDHERLGQVEVTGYTVGQDIEAGDALVRTFISDANPAGVTLVVRARFSPCLPSSCWDPSEVVDDARIQKLRQVVPEEHRDNPALVFDLGLDELAPDFEGIGVYYLSFLDEDTNALGYQFRYHDNVNLVEMLVYPQGAPTPTDTDQLAAQMPKLWSTEVAADVFAAFAEELNVTPA